MRLGSSHGGGWDPQEIHFSRVRMFKAAKYGSHVLKGKRRGGGVQLMDVLFIDLFFIM